jgi:hypothetical protein
MPDGVVTWVDPAVGQAMISRHGQRWTARLSEMEPAVRRAGARVHFDIRREGGVESAVGVRLRGGRRGSPHHHRAGTLVGAHRTDTKGPPPLFEPGLEAGMALAGHPLQVATAWGRYVAAGDLDHAMALYAPQARLYLDDDALAGRRHIWARLETLPVLACGRDPTVHGQDGRIRVRWEPTGPTDPGLDVHCLVEHGLITEQWLAPASRDLTTTTVEAGPAPFALTLAIRGNVDRDVAAYARERIGQLAKLVGEPVLFARVKLVVAADPARERPVLAQAMLDVNGELIRAGVAAHEPHEAIDLLQERLAGKLEERAEHTEALRRHTPGQAQPGVWQHRDLPTVRPDFFDRPAPERQLVRHKSFAPGDLTAEEAAFDLGQLDYDFHLFRDLASGQDSLIERLDGDRYRLQRLNPVAGDRPPAGVLLDATAVARLTVDEAIERLNISGERFVFFASPATRRGNVLYRRYDGHYGLITLEEGPS